MNGALMEWREINDPCDISRVLDKLMKIDVSLTHSAEHRKLSSGLIKKKKIKNKTKGTVIVGVIAMKIHRCSDIAGKDEHGIF